MTFNAKSCLPSFFLTNNTEPKPPTPNNFKGSKSSKVTLPFSFSEARFAATASAAADSSAAAPLTPLGKAGRFLTVVSFFFVRNNDCNRPAKDCFTLVALAGFVGLRAAGAGASSVTGGSADELLADCPAKAIFASRRAKRRSTAYQVIVVVYLQDQSGPLGASSRLSRAPKFAKAIAKVCNTLAGETRTVILNRILF